MPSAPIRLNPAITSSEILLSRSIACGSTSSCKNAPSVAKNRSPFSTASAAISGCGEISSGRKWPRYRLLPKLGSFQSFSRAASEIARASLYPESADIHHLPLVVGAAAGNARVLRLSARYRQPLNASYLKAESMWVDLSWHCLLRLVTSARGDQGEDVALEVDLATARSTSRVRPPPKIGRGAWRGRG